MIASNQINVDYFEERKIYTTYMCID